MMRPALAASACLLALAACSGRPASGPQVDVAEQASGTDASLRGLSVVNDQIVWIGAPDGQVLLTTDGGVHWQLTRIPGAEGLDLRSMHGFDARRALFFTAGQPARLYETRDGGETFSIVWADDTGSAFFDGLAFWNDYEGLAFSDPVDGEFLVLLTSDGGRSWHPAEGLPEPLEGEAGFAASDTSIALSQDGCAFIGTGGGARARVLRGCGYGAAWDAVDTPLASGTPGSGVFSITWTGEKLVAAGGNFEDPDASDGVLAVSRSHGERWATPVAPPHGYRSAVAHLPNHPEILIATGPNGSDISRNSGEIWAPLDALDGYHALAFAPGRRIGWAVGSDGRIARIEVTVDE